MRKLLLSLTCLFGVILTSFSTNYYVKSTDDSGPETLREILQSGSFDICAIPYIDTIFLDPAQMGGNVISLEADLVWGQPAHLIANGDVTINLQGFKIDYNYAPMGCREAKGEEAKVSASSSAMSVFRGITFTGGDPAISLTDGRLLVEECVFESNIGTEVGAIDASINSNVDLCVHNCTFSNNQGSTASAIRLFNLFGSGNQIMGSTFDANSSSAGTTVLIDGVSGTIISDNTFSNNSGATSGALQMQNTTCDVDRCDFIKNTGAKGGALAIVNVGGGDAMLDGCYFESNTGDLGGALFWDPNGSEPFLELYNSTFVGNRLSAASQRKGGAIYVQSQGPQIMNCTFYENGTSDFDGGVSNTDVGGAICLGANTNATIKWSTFTRNFALNEGGAIYGEANTSVTFENSIIVANSAPQGKDISIADGSAAMSNGYNYYNDVFGTGFSPSSWDFAEDPGLVTGAPTDNGGEVPTIALQSCAHALNIVPVSALQYPEDYSGNGVFRPAFNGGDAGAYEVGTSDAPQVSITTDQHVVAVFDTVYMFHDFVFTNDCAESVSLTVEIYFGQAGDSLFMPTAPVGLNVNLSEGAIGISPVNTSDMGLIQDYVRSIGFFTKEAAPNSQVRDVDVTTFESGHSYIYLSSFVSLLLPPEVTLINPTSTGVGDSVKISGSSFDSVTDIQWDGNTITDFVVENDSVIKFVVPDINTTGVITVASPYGTVNSTESLSLALPTVSAMIPSSGYGGDTILIRGAAYGGLDSVTVGGVLTEVLGTVPTNDSLWVVIPNVASGNQTALIYTTAGVGGIGRSVFVNPDELWPYDPDTYDPYYLGSWCGNQTVWIPFQYNGIPDPGVDIEVVLVTDYTDTVLLGASSSYTGFGAFDSVQVSIGDIPPTNYYREVLVQTSDKFLVEWSFDPLFAPIKPRVVGPDTVCVGSTNRYEQYLHFTGGEPSPGDTLFGYEAHWSSLGDLTFDFPFSEGGDRTPDVTFNNVGTVEIRLTDSSECGSASDTLFVEVIDVPANTASVDFEDVCALDTTTLYLNYDGDPITGVKWIGGGFEGSFLGPADESFNYRFRAGSGFSNTSFNLYYALENVCGESEIDTIVMNKWRGLDIWSFPITTVGGSNCVGEVLQSQVTGSEGGGGTLPISVYYTLAEESFVDTIETGAGVYLQWLSSSSSESIVIDSAVDVNGCIDRGGGERSIKLNTPVKIDSIASSSVSCLGDSDGEAQVYYQVLDTGDVVINWTAGGGSFSQSGIDKVTNLTYYEGGYTVQISQNGCQSDTNVAISRGDSVTIPEFSLGGPSTVCDQESATFSFDSPLNQGASPSYDWFVNGDSATSGISYVTDSLVDGDFLEARLTSSYVCARPVDSTISRTLNVLDLASAGSLSSTYEAYCTGDSVTFNIGLGSSVPKWQQSNDGINWVDDNQFRIRGNGTLTVARTNATAVNDTMYLRARFISSCDTAYSDTAMVVIGGQPVGGLPTGAFLCVGEESTISLTGYAGDSIRWESTPSGSNSWGTESSNADTLATNYSYGVNVRAIVSIKESVCLEDTSVSSMIGRIPAAVAGGLSNLNETVCQASYVAQILNGSSGTGVEWFESNGVTSNQILTGITTDTTLNYLTSNSGLEDDTVYIYTRTLGVCDTAYSDTAMVIVQANTNAGVLLGSDICPGDSTPLYLTGGNGDQLTWYERAQGQSVWNLMAAVTSDSTNVSPSSDYEYKVEVDRTGSLCGIDSSVTSIGITSFIAAGGLSSAALEYCSGDTTDVTVFGSIGTVTWFLNGALYTGPVDDTTVSITIVNAGIDVDTSYVYARVTSTCDTVFTDSVQVIVQPEAVGGTGLGFTVCSGVNAGDINLTGQVGEVVKWQFNTDGVNWMDIVNDTPTESFINLSDTTNYRAIVSSSPLCLTDTSDVITVNVNEVPVVDVSLLSVGDTAICMGDTISYQLDVTQGQLPLDYHLFVGGALYYGTMTTSSDLVEVVGLGSGLNSVVFDSIIDVNSCKTYNVQPSGIQEIEMLDLPLVSLDSIVDESCDGFNDGAVYLTVSHSQVVNFNWSDGSINEDLTAVHDSLFNLQVVDVLGCHIDTNFTVAQGAPTIAPAITIIGVDTLCAGDSTLFTINVTSEGSDPIYDWLINGIPQVSDTNQFMYTNPLDGEVISVIVEVAENCAVPDTAVDTLAMVVHALPVIPVIIGNANPICNTLGEPYAVSAVVGETYDWISTTGTVTTNASTDTALVDVLTAGVETVSVVATSLEGCVSDTATFDVTIANCGPEASFVQSADTICPGETIQFVSTSLYTQGGETYEWLINGIDAGIDNDTLDFVFSASGLFDVQLIVAENATSDTATILNAVQVDSLPTVAISGVVTSPVCVTTVNTYSADLVRADTVVWSGSAVTNVSNVVGANADLELSESGLIIATASNACGTDADTANVEVVQLIVSEMISGPDVVCENADSMNFSLTTPSNADSIMWFATNANIVNEVSPEEVEVSFASVVGNIQVVSYNLCGTDTSEVDVSIGLLRELIDLSQDMICPGQEVSILAVSEGYDSYEWHNSEGIIEGADSNMIVTAVADSFHVVLEAGGCTGYSDSVEVREHTIENYNPFVLSDTTLCDDSQPYVLEWNADTLHAYDISRYTYFMQRVNPITTEVIDTVLIGADTTYSVNASVHFVMEVEQNDNQCRLYDTVVIGVLPGFELYNDSITVFNEGVEIDLNLTDNDYQYKSDLRIISVTQSNDSWTADSLAIVAPDSLSLVYVPNNKFSGNDTLVYTVANRKCPIEDPQGSATVILKVNPTAVTDSAEVSLEDSVVQVIEDITLLLNDLGDFNEDSLRIETVETDRGGVVSLDTLTGNIFITYPSSASDSLLGLDVYESVEYRVVDHTGEEALGVLKVLVKFPDDIYTSEELVDSVVDNIEPVVHNLVTPNGDNINDGFKIELLLDGVRVFPDSNQVRIFNKWGDLVYTNLAYQETDEDVFVGLDDNGQRLLSGTYYYVLQYVYTREKRNGETKLDKTTISGFLQLTRE